MLTTRKAILDHLQACGTLTVASGRGEALSCSGMYFLEDAKQPVLHVLAHPATLHAQRFKQEARAAFTVHNGTPSRFVEGVARVVDLQDASLHPDVIARHLEKNPAARPFVEYTPGLHLYALMPTWWRFSDYTAGAPVKLDEHVAENALPATSKVWLRALRAFSFTASIIPVLFGGALAGLAGVVDGFRLFAAVVGAVVLHAAVNLLNDADDYRRGVDVHGALGGSGVLTEGWLTERQVRYAAWGCSVAAAILGTYALWPVFMERHVVAAVLVGGALLALGYTASPLGYKYVGLGDLPVLLLMGPLMVLGGMVSASPMIDETRLWGAVWCALPIGFLVEAILHVNNLRDRGHDEKAGIKTLALWLGERGSRAVMTLLVGGAFLSVVVLVLTNRLPVGALSAGLALAVATPLMRDIFRAADGQALAAAHVVERTALLHMAFGLLLTLSVTVTAVMGAQS